MPAIERLWRGSPTTSAPSRASSGCEPKARVSYQRAAELREALARDHPDVPLYREELAGTYNNIGNLLRDTGKLSKARPAFERAIALKERLTLEHSKIAEYRSSLAISLTNLGLHFAQLGSQSDALPPAQRAAALQEQLVHDSPEVVEFRFGLASSLGLLGSLQRQAGKRDDALRSLRRSLALSATVPIVQPSELYNLACVHALCARESTVGTGRWLEERAERESHANQAMDALRSDCRGLHHSGVDLARSDLELLRSRDDFRTLIMDMAFPADPFARVHTTP